MENKDESKSSGFIPTEQEYLKDRLWNRILRYHKKGINNRKMFHASQATVVIAGVLITFINVLELGSYEIRIISSVLGGIIIAVSSIQQLKKFQENWILFRTSEESLRREYYLFISNAGEYADLPDKEKKTALVEKAESIILSQYSKFFGMHKEKPKTVTAKSGGKTAEG